MSVRQSAAVTLRVIVVEDDARYRASLETLLGHTPGFALAASFGTAESALAWFAEAAEPRCDVVVMDVSLPRMSGITATSELKATHPALPIVMLTVFEEPGTILQAICAGANGYLLKSSSARELLAQLQAMAAGGAPMTAGVARTVLELVRARGGAVRRGAPVRLDLTEREQDVLRCLVRGQSYKQAAAALDISIDTVRSHIRALYGKLQVHSVAAAVSRAIRDGLV